MKRTRRISPEKFVFLDEFGCNKAMTRRYARSPEGERVRGDAPLNYGPNVSVLAAMRHDGLTATMRIEGATNGNVFLAFLEHFLCPTLRKGDIVVMDNLPAHKVEGVAEILAKAGASLLYLPPYSPDYNPIELCFSKIKEFLRAMEARTLEALDQGLAQAFNLITPEDSAGWFKHCGYGLPN